MWCAKAATNSSPWTSRSGKVIRRVAVGRVPKGISLQPGRHEGVRRELVERHRIGPRYHFVPGHRHVQNGLRADQRRGCLRRHLHRESDQRRHLRPRRRHRPGSSGAWPRAAARVISRSLPAENRSIASHVYPNIGAFRTAPVSELTVIDSEERYVTRRERIQNAAGMFHIAFAPAESSESPARFGRRT